MDPILLQTGPLPILWYGLLFAAGLYIVQWMFDREGKPVREGQMLSIQPIVLTLSLTTRA
jgi:prolipoprotein diacylglyceryltransferase